MPLQICTEGLERLRDIEILLLEPDSVSLCAELLWTVDRKTTVEDGFEGRTDDFIFKA